MLFGFVSPNRASTLQCLLRYLGSTGDSPSTPVQTGGQTRGGENGHGEGLVLTDMWNILLKLLRLNKRKMFKEVLFVGSEAGASKMQ